MPTVTDHAQHHPDTPARASLLLPVLVGASVLVHATALLMWPADPPSIGASAPLTQVTVNLRGAQTVAATTASQGTASPATTATPAAVPATARAQTVPAAVQTAHKSLTATAATEHTTTVATGSTTAPSHTKPSTAAQTHAVDDGDDLRKQLNSRLQHALLAHFDYPPVARRRGWEGVVQVGLRVEADGQLSRLRLIASSGHALLDRAALLSLGRVAPLQDAIDWLNGRQVDMILPVRYQLVDS